MKILLLGGTGFIGQAVVQKLIKKNHDISLAAHERLPEGILKIKDRLTIFRGSILDKNMLRGAFKNQDLVVNLVGQICEEMNLFYSLNIDGTLNVMELCIENKVSSIILVSSSAVYGESNGVPSKESDNPNPRTLYALAKRVSEKLCAHFAGGRNINLSILRLSNVYGPGKKAGIVHNIIECMGKGSEVAISDDGGQMRDFIYIDDAAEGIVKAIEKMPSGIEIFNISGAKKVKILDILSMIEKELHRKAKVKFFRNRDYDERCLWADNGKAKALLGFSPEVDINSGIKKTVASLKKAK